MENHKNLRMSMTAYGRVFSLLVMIALGVLLPQFHVFSWMVQYLLMVMLFYSFLGIEFNPASLHKNVLLILVANLAVAFAGYFVLAPSSLELALVAFVTGIAPTAISSPVIISFIAGRVDYMVASVLLTNIGVALVIPFVLPWALGKSVEVSTWQVLKPVFVTMFTPLILALLVRRLPGEIQRSVQKGGRFSFPLWLVNLFLISSKAGQFLRYDSDFSAEILLKVAGVSLLICVINFMLGAMLGGREYRQEASQALGQKNNSFVIWLALTFINPLVAMGPTFYVLYHNLYNSWQIYLYEKKRKAGASQ